jgi:hypothetical protein
MIVVRHDLPLPEGKLRTGCSFVLGLNTVLDLAIVYKITSYFTEIFNYIWVESLVSDRV